MQKHKTIIKEDLILVRTCRAFPEQYDVVYKGDIIGYIRYRQGQLTCQPCDNGELLFPIIYYHEEQEATGVLPDEHRGALLDNCLTSLVEFWSQENPKALTYEDMLEKIINDLT